MGVVYWNLILQLLRTNEQFKNIVRETIVIDPCDLQSIVFNSFSCYLNSKQLSRSGGDSVISDPNDDDRLIAEIEAWLLANAIDNYSGSDVTDATDCDLNNCDFSYDNNCKGVLDIQYGIEYTSVVSNFFYPNGTPYNYRSHTDSTSERSFIDGVFLTECSSTNDSTTPTTVVQSVEHNAIVTGVKKITNFLTNNVFDHFFVCANIDETKRKDDAKLNQSDSREYSVYVQDYDTAESNSLFLQLFEITAGVMILANCEESSGGK